MLHDVPLTAHWGRFFLGRMWPTAVRHRKCLDFSSEKCYHAETSHPYRERMV